MNTARRGIDQSSEKLAGLFIVVAGAEKMLLTPQLIAAVRQPEKAAQKARDQQEKDKPTT
jgi:hypothetical protein